MGDPGRFEISVAILPTAGYSVEHMPKNARVENDVGALVLDARAGGGGITVSRVYLRKRPRAAAETIAQVRQLSEAITLSSRDAVILKRRR